ncbi:cilia- and flagella-associated protein 61-like [Carlito syrichta]|uniref:Cilia- and flagella-associated protein 61-like n=1 Tax=Carlito syrichta TaxID=1868482 RepID=A0A3Q0DR95_CARSF|nr:cilia- and flagella-associated protein 61-like [Carlito syrichta]
MVCNGMVKTRRQSSIPMLAVAAAASLEPPADTELRNSHQDSLKVIEEPQEPVSPETMESVQGKKITGEAASEERLSVVQSGDLSELEDIKKLSSGSTGYATDHRISSRTSASVLLSEEPSHFRPIYRGASAAFCIQLFCIDEKHEARSLDFMNFVFRLFPDKTFCIISLPHLTPEFTLITPGYHPLLSQREGPNWGMATWQAQGLC